MPAEDDLRALRLEVERMKEGLDDIKHVQALQVRADGAIEELVLTYFDGKGGPTKAKIYLAVDGKRSVSDIATHVDTPQPHVTRKTREMYRLGLLEYRTDGTRKVYAYSVIEKALHLSRKLRKIADGS